jgi:peptidoglycan hydrolase-like protein with peptidoglycan-binding domain
MDGGGNMVSRVFTGEQERSAEGGEYVRQAPGQGLAVDWAQPDAGLATSGEASAVNPWAQPEHGAFGGEHEFELHHAGADLEKGKPGAKVFQSPRFMGDQLLEDIAGGKKSMGNPSVGIAVTKVQQALVDLGGVLPKFGIDGKFGAETAAAVKAFQTTVPLPDSGTVDAATLAALDAKFAGNAHDAAMAQAPTPATAPTEGVEYALGTAPAELMDGTRKLNATEKKAANDALAPVSEIDPVTGKVRVFKEDVGKGLYIDRLRSVVDAEVTNQFDAMAKGKAAAHADPTKLHQMGDVEKVANESKRVTDLVFGDYALGPAFNQVDNLRDRWAVQEKRMADLEAAKTKGAASGASAGDKAAATAAEAELDGIAQWRVQKILNEVEEVADLNEEHGALVNRAKEKGYIEQVRDEIKVSRRADLLEIHKGWPGAANPNTHEVFLQMFKSADDTGNRRFMWDAFQTLIHEYIHTLTHSAYSAYADGLPDAAKSHALREGMTDYNTKIVWATVNTSDAALRKTVEGPFHDPLVTDPVPALGTYDAAVEAEQLVGIVGARNAFAAYFLGQVELIGG